MTEKIIIAGFGGQGIMSLGQGFMLLGHERRDAAYRGCPHTARRCAEARLTAM